MVVSKLLIVFFVSIFGFQAVQPMSLCFWMLDGVKLFSDFKKNAQKKGMNLNGLPDFEYSAGAFHIFDYHADRDLMSCQKMIHQKAFCFSDQSVALSSPVMLALDDAKVASRVCVMDGVTVGFINYQIYSPWSKGSIQSLFEIGAVCNIIHLTVDEAFNEIGVESALLHCAIEDCQARAGKSPILLVSEDDLEQKDLLRLYKYLGFKKHSPIPLPRNIWWKKKIENTSFSSLMLEAFEFFWANRLQSAIN